MIELDLRKNKIITAALVTLAFGAGVSNEVYADANFDALKSAITDATTTSYNLEGDATGTDSIGPLGKNMMSLNGQKHSVDGNNA